MKQVEMWLKKNGKPWEIGLKVIVTNEKHHYLNHKGEIAGIMYRQNCWWYLIELFDGFTWFPQHYLRSNNA